MTDYPRAVDALARSRTSRGRASLLAVTLAIGVGALPAAFSAAPSPGGFGGFGDPLEVGVVPEPTRVTTGDIDRVSGNDVAITTRADDPAAPGTLTVLVNDGSGVGYAFVPSLVGVDPLDVVLDDFDQMNGPDAAVANAGDGTVAILLNTGAAPGENIFEVARFEPVGGRPVAIASGDITLDGFADLAVANAGDNTVQILENDRAGGFSLRQTLDVGAQPIDLALGDLYGANESTDLIVVIEGGYQGYRNDGQGNLILTDGGDVPGLPIVIEPEDVDGDKDVDAVILARSSGDQGAPGTLTVLRNMSGDGFETITFAGGSGPSSLAIGDFDRDNDVDAMVVGEVLGAQGDIRGVLAFRNMYRETGVLEFVFTDLLDVDANQRFVAGELLDRPDGPRDLVTIDVDPQQVPLRGNVAVLLGEPNCRGDLNGDQRVDMADLKVLIETWGVCPGPCPPVCLADINGDCEVSMQDLLLILTDWGECQ